MYPKIIWQDIVSVRGYDRPMRCVQTAEFEATIEWSEERDAMGNQAWKTFDTWYDSLVGDIVRKIVTTTSAGSGVAMWMLAPVLNNRKIALIKLVREATAQYGKLESAKLGHPDGANVFGCMGLKDAKDFVEAWIAQQT